MIAMQQPFFTKNNQPTNICLITFWQTNLNPTIPFLADIVHLSLPKIQQVLPNIIEILILQLTHKLKNQPLSNILPKINDNTWFAKTLNFHYLPQQLAQYHTINQQFFDNQKHYYLILGDLIHKSQLPITKLEPVFKAIISISLLLLTDFIDNNPQINQQDFIEWLNFQPNFIKNLEKNSLILIFDIQLPQNSTNDWQNTFAETLDIYQNQHFLTLKSQPINKQNLTKNSNVFHKTTNHKPLPKWLQPFQKYWIATATVLSMVVIGGIGFFNKTEKNLPEKPTIENKQKYNDVAIMKVASTTETTTLLPPVVPPVQPPKVENKPTKIEDNNKKEIAKSESKKVEKNQEKPTAKNEKKVDKKFVKDKDKKENKKEIKEKSKEKTDKKSTKDNKAKSEPKKDKKGDK